MNIRISLLIGTLFVVGVGCGPKYRTASALSGMPRDTGVVAATPAKGETSAWVSISRIMTSEDSRVTFTVKSDGHYLVNGRDLGTLSAQQLEQLDTAIKNTAGGVDPSAGLTCMATGMNDFLQLVTSVGSGDPTTGLDQMGGDLSNCMDSATSGMGSLLDILTQLMSSLPSMPMPTPPTLPAPPSVPTPPTLPTLPAPPLPTPPTLPSLPSP